MKANRIIQGDALTELKKLPAGVAQAIIADPPYFNVLEDEAWDTQWKTAADYLAWCDAWAVSYTHLDVYKRQLRNPPRHLRFRGWWCF